MVFIKFEPTAKDVGRNVKLQKAHKPIGVLMGLEDAYGIKNYYCIVSWPNFGVMKHSHGQIRFAS